RLADYAELRRQFTGKHRVIADNQWTPLERVIMASLRAVNGELCRQIRCCLYRTHDAIQERNISLGQSDTAYAWTDGKAAIAFDRNFVKSSFKDGVDGILRLLAVWVHEYLHDEPDSDAHNHSPEFLDAF